MQGHAEQKQAAMRPPPPTPHVVHTSHGREWLAAPHDGWLVAVLVSTLCLTVLVACVAVVRAFALMAKNLVARQLQLEEREMRARTQPTQRAALARGHAV